MSCKKISKGCVMDKTFHRYRSALTAMCNGAKSVWGNGATARQLCVQAETTARNLPSVRKHATKDQMKFVDKVIHCDRKAVHGHWFTQHDRVVHRHHLYPRPDLSRNAIEESMRREAHDHPPTKAANHTFLFVGG